MRRFSNNKTIRKRRTRRIRRFSRKRLKPVLKRNRQKFRNRRKSRKRIKFARGTKKAVEEHREPKLLTQKQKRDRNYSRRYKYCLGPLDD